MPKLPTPEDKERWVEMHEQGWSLKDIAEKTGFSPDTVSKHLREGGLRGKRPRGRAGQSILWVSSRVSGSGNKLRGPEEA